jgi:hypothetical protein
MNTNFGRVRIVIFFYALRHTVITRLVQSGVVAKVAQDWLGIAA